MKYSKQDVEASSAAQEAPTDAAEPAA
jgi:hypothetical protein